MKRLLTALAAALLCPFPALARVDLGTPALLKTAESLGITITYNSPEFCHPGVSGLFDSERQLVALCYHTWPDDNAHDTVRHELFHFAQHCASTKRGFSKMEPILTDRTQLSTWVQSVLIDDDIVFVKSSYPRDKWLTELEAWAAAKHYTAAQIGQIVRQWCQD